VVDYYDAERTLLKREEPVISGRHHGTVTWWYRNGKKQFEAEYVSGEPEGRTVWYRETQKGAPDSTEYEGFWTNGELTQATTWDANNVQTGQVVDGNGTLTFHHPNGQKRMEEVYTSGKLTGNKFWDEEGKPVESVDPSFIPARPRPIN
jgi:antitoxin component YwqK of YwqJK toxin-antitoxin module